MGNKILPVKFNIKLPAVVTKKDKWYISSCPALDVVTQGRTIEQAKKNLEDALSLFLISCYEMGTLDAVLKECGFVPSDDQIDEFENLDMSDYINVPLPFIINTADRRCHA